LLFDNSIHALASRPGGDRRLAPAAIDVHPVTALRKSLSKSIKWNSSTGEGSNPNLR
jgi:hypothetical protein